MVKCPHCGKELTENEMYCWNCENDVSDIKNKRERPVSEDSQNETPDSSKLKDEDGNYKSCLFF